MTCLSDVLKMMSDHSPLQTPRFLVSPLVLCIDRDKHVKREDKKK